MISCFTPGRARGRSESVPPCWKAPAGKDARPEGTDGGDGEVQFLGDLVSVLPAAISFNTLVAFAIRQQFVRRLLGVVGDGVGELHGHGRADVASAAGHLANWR